MRRIFTSSALLADKNNNKYYIYNIFKKRIIFKKITNITETTNENPILHNKTSSLDKRTTSKYKYINLNKIFKQNLGIQNIEQSMFQKKYSKF